LFWGEQQAVVAFVAAACIFLHAAVCRVNSLSGVRFLPLETFSGFRRKESDGAPAFLARAAQSAPGVKIASPKGRRLAVVVFSILGWCWKPLFSAIVRHIGIVMARYMSLMGQ
jgi:hypothetical protein